VEINSAWDTIRENITISTKDIVGYYDLKKNKPWFDHGCSKLDQRNQANIVHLHPVPRRYSLSLSLLRLSLFKTLNSVFNTCHFIKIFKTLHVSASISHPQVLKNCVSRKLLRF
jgi:hypothetical protein